MAILKCKMCGGNLEVDGTDKVVTCPYCGSQQTVPSSDSEKKVKLYNRANSCRLRNEFDRALSVYQGIISEFPDEAEAYWGICLCKYGIEYVDDPRTGDKVPTCHRTDYESILNDADYKMAIDLSDVESREVYEKEAEEIDRLQKDILSVSQKEEPYDIFICYKETDDKGERTQDSVIAQDLYSSLTEKGYKVFFARITLESKIGSQYEPIIFAALRSAKVMLVIGTDPAYFEAVWVRNEWSRYLSFMKEAKDKYFIPCYKNMDAYDMPKEFQGFQAQDMDKIGFMQDLVRGIEKLSGKGSLEYRRGGGEIKYRLKNILVQLENAIRSGNKEEADWLIKQAMIEDPNCAEIYFYQMLIALGMKSKEELAQSEIELEKNGLFQKALSLATPEFAAELNEMPRRTEENRRARQYEVAMSLYVGAMGTNIKSMRKAADLFDQLHDYKDSQEQSRAIRDRVEKIGQDSLKKKDYIKALDCFTDEKKIREISEQAYNYAIQNAGKNGWESVDESIKVLSCLSYKNSITLAEKLKRFRDRSFILVKAVLAEKKYSRFTGVPERYDDLPILEFPNLAPLAMAQIKSDLKTYRIMMVLTPIFLVCGVPMIVFSAMGVFGSAFIFIIIFYGSILSFLLYCFSYAIYAKNRYLKRIGLKKPKKKKN